MSLVLDLLGGTEDLSRFKHPISYVGNPIVGKNIKLTGSDALSINSLISSLRNSENGSLIAWIAMPDATPAANAWIFNFGDTNGNELIGLGILTSGKLYAACIKAGTIQWVLQTNSAVIQDNKWVCISLSQNEIEPIIQVNESIPAQTFTTELDKTIWFKECTAIDNCRIGCLNYNNTGNINFFSGRAKIKIFDDFQSEDDRTEYYLSSRKFV